MTDSMSGRGLRSRSAKIHFAWDFLSDRYDISGVISRNIMNGQELRCALILSAFRFRGPHADELHSTGTRSIVITAWWTGPGRRADSSFAILLPLE